MKSFIALFSSMCLFSLAACEGTPQQKQEQSIVESNVLKEDILSFHYFKDKRTNLCFISGDDLRSNYSVLTNVPCTPEVEKLIEK